MLIRDRLHHLPILVFSNNTLRPHPMAHTVNHHPFLNRQLFSLHIKQLLASPPPARPYSQHRMVNLPFLTVNLGTHLYLTLIHTNHMLNHLSHHSNRHHLRLDSPLSQTFLLRRSRANPPTRDNRIPTPLALPRHMGLQDLLLDFLIRHKPNLTYHNGLTPLQQTGISLHLFVQAV